jgi:uncharacterized protein YbjT (DUF2867 family)
MENISSIIVGSTGLVGNLLLDELSANPKFSAITTLVRRATGRKFSKLSEVVVDFSDINSWKEMIKGDVCFICLGTTIKTAGSKEAFEKVDLELPVKLAQAASENGVKKLLVISSLGANPMTKNFYLRTKGIMEFKVKEVFQGKVHFFRPSLLLGNRSENRTGEKFAQWIMPLLSFLLRGKMKKYRAIEAGTVARAMMNVAVDDHFNEMIIESDRMEVLGK